MPRRKTQEQFEKDIFDINPNILVHILIIIQKLDLNVKFADTNGKQSRKVSLITRLLVENVLVMFY